MDLLLQIENIIENDGSDFELSKLFKKYIKEYKESLPELFESSQGKDFLVKHTKKLDSVISLMYKTVLRRVFDNYLPMRSSIPIAVIALGSYGREQLCVHSDIDLFISYKDVKGFNTQLIIEKLFYLALDSGLKLGHRVHEISDLFKAAGEDITIRTSLMESRFIIGSPFIWDATQRELSKIRLSNQKEFILAKIDEAQIRRKKYPTSMQPNIKETVGGLRDSQLVLWIAQTIYGIKNLRDLTQELFSEEEYKDYRIALELLFRVRSALHLITNKQEDRLILDHMPQVALMLGLKDEKKLTIKVLQAQWRINNFTQIFVKKMVKPYLVDMHNIKKLRANRLSKGIYLLEDRLFASYNLKVQPINTLLKLFIALPDQNYKYSAGFLNQVTYAKISHPLPKTTYALIKELLRKKNIYSFLKLFYDAGILQNLFTSFKKVMHLPQFDGYHQYPVDIHSIKCVEALENIKEPFIQKLYNELTIDEKLLLKIIVLFHDIGKGRKQDHSEVGAKLIVPFASKINLSCELIERGVTLTKHHVLMSNVAFKENIYNENTLYTFMSKIKNTKNLKLLYILTYADINGVSENAYNSFNSKLLLNLYKSALEVSENSDRITDAYKRMTIEKRIQNLKEFKNIPKILQNRLLAVESNLFFFKHTLFDILRIVKRANEIKDYYYDVHTNETLSIEIYRKVPLNVGYLLAALSHLDVASMEIITLFDGVKYFKIEFIKNVSGNELIEVQDIVKNAFDMSKKVELKKVIIKQKEISIDCEHSLTHAEVKINTKNQIGLLAYIMECFESIGINIVSAKIHSTKYKVKDSFLMEKQNDICNNSKKIYKLLTKGF